MPPRRINSQFDHPLSLGDLPPVVLAELDDARGRRARPQEDGEDEDEHGGRGRAHGDPDGVNGEALLWTERNHLVTGDDDAQEPNHRRDQED